MQTRSRAARFKAKQRKNVGLTKLVLRNDRTARGSLPRSSKKDEAPLALATELVDRLGAAVDPRDLVAALRGSRYDSLNRQARQFVEQHSGLRQPPTGRTERAPIPAHHGLHAKEVAAMLGVDKSTVSRYARSGKLYSVGFDGRQRFPLWQFASGHPLPNLAPVASAIPEAWEPIHFARFMTTADEALGDLSPVDWLDAGGGPGRVITLMDEEARA